MKRAEVKDSGKEVRHVGWWLAPGRVLMKDGSEVFLLSRANVTTTSPAEADRLAAVIVQLLNDADIK